ncbi:peptidase of plants and bacteria-domain-containing protein [Naematelia encephala]|uniref:Peptidase of plants and bacteria-domain-containing protein n=1 Tax=Naematelia encephala TaxID=71784 RepID=A0A1Y2B5Z0_9TREE|nr:peptidase of plants and bacteria-domain-containing protein [Naematelia encephala]
MPNLQHFFRNLSIAHPPPAPPSQSNPPSSESSRPSSSDPITTYFLGTSSSSSSPTYAQPPLAPIPSTNIAPIAPSSLIFSLTHPPPATSEQTSFFFTALPDPIGFLYHSAQLIRDHLVIDPQARWRHQLIELKLVDEDGLAWTSDGRMSVSLRWMSNILDETKDGRKDMRAAAKEIKGVLLHELTHVIQHDGSGTCPIWLIESLADHIRLQAHLDPPHWRKAGVGKRDKGWEEGYDAGARFLTWLVGSDSELESTGQLQVGVEEVDEGEGQGGYEIQKNEIGFGVGSGVEIEPTKTQGAKTPMTTKYPLPSTGEPGMGQRQGGGREKSTNTTSGSKAKPRRRGPFPEFVKLLDARLEYNKYQESWWVEMTGADLSTLWKEYLDYYA